MCAISAKENIFRHLASLQLSFTHLTCVATKEEIMFRIIKDVVYVTLLDSKLTDQGNVNFYSRPDQHIVWFSFLPVMPARPISVKSCSCAMSCFIVFHAVYKLPSISPCFQYLL